MQSINRMNRLTEFEVVDGRAGLLTFTGRLFLSAIFFVSAYMLMTDWSGMRQMLTLHGLGQPAPYLMALSLVCELTGAVSLLFGCYTRAGALVLTVYLAGLTLVLNNFWAYPVAEQPLQIAMCLKNLAIMGGLLNLLAYGPGPWSVDCKRLLDPRLARALSNEPNRSVLVEDDSIIV